MMKYSNRNLNRFLICAVSLHAMVSNTSVYGISSNPRPFREIQPDGKSIELRINGDESISWLSDLEGYTVLHDLNTGEYRYAQDDGHGGLECSNVAVGNDNDDGDDYERGNEDYERDNEDYNLSEDPIGTVLDVRRKKHPSWKISHHNRPTIKGIRSGKDDCKNMWCDGVDNDEEHDHEINLGGHSSLRGTSYTNSTSTTLNDNHRDLRQRTGGVLRNLVIPMLWSDHHDRNLPTRDDLNVLMNNNGPHPLCPTGSIRDFFSENSYGRFTLESVVIDWIPMTHTEAYYANGQRGLSRHFQNAIVEALNYIDDNELVNFEDFDVDNDLRIDAITFLHSGYAAEFGGTDSFGTDYTDRIWSHKWNLWARRFTSARSGVRVNDYHISSAVWSTSGSDIARIGVIAHEIGHFIGLPDLYDGNSNGNGIGSYGIMGNAWGFDGSQFYPPHFSAWSKLQVGWLDAMEPTEGRNFIEASEVQNPTLPQVYKISENFPRGEYLLIENRQRIGFDQRMPQGGLVIWHIDEKASLTREGYPGQRNWPKNGNHYRVAVVPADGRYQLEQGLNHGDGRDVFHALGTDKLVGCRSSNSCQYPNTDSYQNGRIRQTDISISAISSSGYIMSFNFAVGFDVGDLTSSPTQTPTVVASSMPTQSPSVTPSDIPTSEPSATPTDTLSVSPSDPPTAVPTLSPSTTISSSPSTSPTISPTFETTTIVPTLNPSTQQPSTASPSESQADEELNIYVKFSRDDVAKGGQYISLSATVEGSIPPLRFAWSFGDGGIAFGFDGFQRRFYEFGDYTVHALVIDGSGRVEVTRFKLTV